MRKDIGKVGKDILKNYNFSYLESVLEFISASFAISFLRYYL